VTTIFVRNADRMMTAARPQTNGIELTFADGAAGLIPFADIPGIGDASNLKTIELPNPYIIVLKNRAGEDAEIPWDFARHYCDASLRPRVEAIAAEGRQSIGARVRSLRAEAGMTQQALASRAGVGRVTLVRIEKGEQSPRYETLVALVKALGRSFGELAD
jgi:DNA-binding XRE family transcriptional regulator